MSKTHKSGSTITYHLVLMTNPLESSTRPVRFSTPDCAHHVATSRNYKNRKLLKLAHVCLWYCSIELFFSLLSRN
jgi:hypothetical protein